MMLSRITAQPSSQDPISSGSSIKVHQDSLNKCLRFNYIIVSISTSRQVRYSWLTSRITPLSKRHYLCGMIARHIAYAIFDQWKEKRQQLPWFGPPKIGSDWVVVAFYVLNLPSTRLLLHWSTLPRVLSQLPWLLFGNSNYHSVMSTSVRLINSYT